MFLSDFSMAHQGMWHKSFPFFIAQSMIEKIGAGTVL